MIATETFSDNRIKEQRKHRKENGDRNLEIETENQVPEPLEIPTEKDYHF